MHTVELYRKVRLACRDGMSERAAARHFGISRESVKKMLCFSVPPGYRRTAPVRRPKLDGFTEIIDQWLKEDLKQLRKQRHTAKRIFDRLRAEHGFSGGYTIQTVYSRSRGRRRAMARSVSRMRSLPAMGQASSAAPTVSAASITVLSARWVYLSVVSGFR